MTTTRNRPARPGFTLIEILVAMSLIILLAALALGVSQSGMFGSQKVISGGDRASGWLLIAKQRAMRDGLPRGVRFFNTVGGATGNPNAFTEAAYIELPDAWVPNQQQEGNPSGARIVFVYTWEANPPSPPSPPGTVPFKRWIAQEIYYVSNVQADLDEYDQRVSVNDLLVLPEFGKSFKILNPNTGGTTGITSNTYGGSPTPTLLSSTNARRVEVSLMPDLSAAGNPLATAAAPHLPTLTMYKFGFQRPAQPLLGEPALQLTGGTSIDYRPGPYTPTNPSTSIGVRAVDDLATTTTPLGQYFDILFSPSGQVLNNNEGIVCLWVRETSKAPHPRFDTAGAVDTPASFDQAGPQVLIVLNTRNGLLSTQPINPPPATDPYQFAKDGVNSGL